MDLVAELRALHVQGLVSRLGDRYYADAESIREAVDLRSSFNLVHLESMMKVDVFVAPDAPWQIEALGRSGRDTLDDGAGAREICVASPEDIVLHKLRWYRMGGETSERQWSDVAGVLRVQHGRLDLDYLRRWATSLSVLDLLERAIADSDR